MYIRCLLLDVGTQLSGPSARWGWGWLTAQGAPPGPVNLSLMSSVPENAISLRLEEAQSTPTHTLGLTSSSCETTRVREEVAQILGVLSARRKQEELKPETKGMAALPTQHQGEWDP